MKRTTAIAMTVVGCVMVVGTTPVFVHWFSSRKPTWNLKADYVEGLAVMAGWNDNNRAKKRFDDEAYQIREGVTPIAFDCENKAEQAVVWAEIWATASKVTRTGHDIAGEHPGRLTFYVPHKEADTLKVAGERALAASRAK